MKNRISDLDVSKFSLMLLMPIFLMSSIVSAQHTTVLLLNGEEVKGELLSIGTELITLETNNYERVIERDEIRLQYSSEKNQPKRERPKVSLVPISKRFNTEIDAGLTFANPFAIRIGMTEWCRLGTNYELGIGTSVQFYRFTMFNANINARRTFGKRDFVQPFFECGFGASYLGYVNGLNFRQDFGVPERPPGYEASFSTVYQAHAGPGLFIDTGLGVAFTSRLVYNATWFQLTQNEPLNGRQDFYIKGQYFVSSASLLAGFIF